MNLCSDNNHGEVCYETRDCPACKLWDETVELSNDLDASKDLVKELRDKIYEMENATPPSPYDR
jgi:hypothetical protein